MAIQKPITLKEKNAVKFGVNLIQMGYGYIIRTPIHNLAKELTEHGYKISFMSVLSYWRTLERMGYATKELGARMFGTTYRLNRYIFQKYLEAE